MKLHLNREQVFNLCFLILGGIATVLFLNHCGNA